ncbi:hypothetical protein AB0J28_12665 [Streptosporangium canum]|uniref:hypothetical protein n=1 Tax=Streptosporangium canum TaxID=324952 RepID=UPI003443AD9B
MLLRYLALNSVAFTPEQLEEFDRQPFAAPMQPAVYQVLRRAVPQLRAERLPAPDRKPLRLVSW